MHNDRNSGQDARLQAAEQSLGSTITQTRMGINAERFAHAFWPLWTLLFVVIAALAFEIHILVSPGWLIVLVIVVSAGLGALLVTGYRQFTLAGRDEAIRRLDDALPGRPLAALGDTQAIGVKDPASVAVWTRHLERMTTAAKAARVSWPDLRLSQGDPNGLRLIGIVALIAAAIFAGRGDKPSLTDALLTDGTPDFATGPSFEAWANPPVYTGKPVIYLTESDVDALTLPVGTVVTVRIYGDESGFGLAESVSGEDIALAQIAEGIQSADFTVAQDGAFTLKEGSSTLGTWDVTVVADTPPSIELGEPMTRTVTGAMELSYKATDDYGVAHGTVEITLDLDRIDRRFGLVVAPEPRESVTLDLPLPLSGNTDEVEEILVEDLSQHPWSGLPVHLTLTAFDDANQEGRAENIEVTLPGRRFFDPLAKALIEQRRNLLWSRGNTDYVSQMLRVITHQPDDIFTNQTAYLMTRMALRRITYMSENEFSVEEQEDVAELLWQVALLVEDGSLSDARERLRRAQERLTDALRNGATEDEIAELMRELREATDRYMQMLAEEAQKNGEMQQSQGESNRLITQDQIQALMDRIQELADSGQTEEADKLLQELAELLENLQMQTASGSGSQGEQSEGEQALEDLQDTLREQQELADDSFQQLQREFQEGRNQGRNQQGQQGQQGQPQQSPIQPGQGESQGQQGQGEQGEEGQQQGQNGQGEQQQGENGQGPGQDGNLGAGELADRQNALRQMLNELRGRLPGPSSEEGQTARRALEDAERNMRDAQRNLDKGDLPGALDRQADAMESLREGMRNLGEELQQQAQQNQGQSGAEQSNNAARDNRDPLGRPRGTRGSIRSDENVVPDVSPLQRAQELFDEIRRRSSDQTRPTEELDYLRRLLDRF